MFGTTVATQLSTVTLRGVWWNCLTETSNFIMSPSRYSAAGRTNCQSSERHRTKMCRFDEKHKEQGVGYWRTVTWIFTTGTVRKWLIIMKLDSYRSWAWGRSRDFPLKPVWEWTDSRSASTARCSHHASYKRKKQKPFNMSHFSKKGQTSKLQKLGDGSWRCIKFDLW